MLEIGFLGKLSGFKMVKFRMDMIVYCIPVVAPLVQAFGEYSQRAAVENSSHDTFEGWSQKIGAVRQLKNNEEDAFKGAVLQTITALFISAMVGLSPLFAIWTGLALLQMGVSVYLIRRTDREILSGENKFLDHFKKKLEQHVDTLQNLIRDPSGLGKSRAFHILATPAKEAILAPIIKHIKENIEPMIPLCRELFISRGYMQFTKKDTAERPARTDRLHELESACDKTLAMLDRLKANPIPPDLQSELRNRCPLVREADLFINTVYVENL